VRKNKFEGWGVRVVSPEKKTRTTEKGRNRGVKKFLVSGCCLGWLEVMGGVGACPIPKEGTTWAAPERRKVGLGARFVRAGKEL